MRRLLVTVILLALSPLICPASDFDWLVREFSRQTSAKVLHIPLFGVARFAVAIGNPGGTSELHLAVFQDVELQPQRFTQITDSLVGPSWKPIIRVRSRNGESSNIYAQPNGKNLRVLLTVLDSGDATFVHVRIRPEALMKFVDEHGSSREKHASVVP